MRRMVEKLLNQFGVELYLEGKRFRGIFQPVTGRLERLAEHQPGVLGTESRDRYICIAPLEPELREGDTLTVAGKCYHIRTVQQIRGGDGPLYRWAMCVEKGREEPWGMNS
jgi:hypothetical protein